MVDQNLMTENANFADHFSCTRFEKWVSVLQ